MRAASRRAASERDHGLQPQRDARRFAAGAEQQAGLEFGQLAVAGRAVVLVVVGAAAPDVRPAEDGQQYVIEGEITQRILMKPAMAVKEEVAGQYFKGMVPITVVGKSGKEYRKRVLIETAKVPFKFNVPEKPKEVVFNKNGESLGYDVKVVEKAFM